MAVLCLEKYNKNNHIYTNYSRTSTDYFEQVNLLI